jgi:short-subunit dehydrogenase
MAHRWNTALVTGASSGIGDAIARQLATQGTDLVVVARDRGRLDALAKELIERERVSVEVLAADLADEQELAHVEGRVADLARPVDLLVNNAGFGTSGAFAELPIDDEEREIKVNVLALVRLTRAALPGMVDRGHGAVMNISSIASLQAMPQYATYGATKAFVTSFTESLSEELRGSGVTATAVLPGFTRTEFQQRAGIREGGTAGAMPDFMWQSASDCAREAIAATAKGRAVHVTGGLNRVLAVATGPLPRVVKRRVVGEMSKRF